MTNVIEGLAKRLDNLPAELADDCIRAFKVVAERNGGRMMNGKYQLTAKVKKRYNRPSGAWIVMEGFPQGFWVWRERGAAAHLIKPKPRKKRGRGSSKRKANWTPGPLAGGLGHPVWGQVLHPGFLGALKWTKTVEQADEAIAALIQRALEKGA